MAAAPSPPSTREVGVYLFYSLLTWYLAPLLLERAGRTNKTEGFVVGFAASIALYEAMGKKFIHHIIHG